MGGRRGRELQACQQHKHDFKEQPHSVPGTEGPGQPKQGLLRYHLQRTASDRYPAGGSRIEAGTRQRDFQKQEETQKGVTLSILLLNLQFKYQTRVWTLEAFLLL